MESNYHNRRYAIALIAAMLTVTTLFFAVNMDTGADADEGQDLYITEQPSDQFINDRTNAVFTIGAVGADTYEWQYAAVEDDTWTDVTNGEGADTGMLVISPSDYSDKEYMFRCVVSDPASNSMESQPAYLYNYKTPTPTTTNVHYVSTVEDLFMMGSGKVYKNAYWNLDDVYVQTADIDFTDSNNTAVIEKYISNTSQIKISYAVNDDNVIFTLEESGDKTTFQKIPDINVNYNFGITTGTSTTSNGTITINDSDSGYSGSPMVFSIGGTGTNGDFAVSIEVSGDSGATASKTSYSLGNFVPIGFYGSQTVQPKIFTGLFDGRGYSIIGMETADYDLKERAYSGIFVLFEGTAQNICMEGGSSTAIGPSAGAGGIIGCGEGFVYNSYNTGTVGSTKYSGGITAQEFQTPRDGEFRDCYNTGTIGGNISGGIAGSVHVMATDCHNTGNVAGTDLAGGIMAEYHGKPGISDCYNTGIVMSSTAAGGIISSVNQPEKKTVSISDCYNTGDIYVHKPSEKTTSYAGGIVGSSTFSATVSGCYNLGKITVSDVNVNSEIGNLYVGGIIGYSTGSDAKIIWNCYNKGDIDVKITGDSYSNNTNNASVGGIAGKTAGSISSSYNEGNMIFDNGDNNRVKVDVGGIVGDGADVKTSYNSGSITTSSVIADSTGGIAGTAKNISDCYNIGAIDAKAAAGGIAASAVTVTNSYNAGAFGNNGGNGISGTGTVTDCYYLNGTGTGTKISDANELNDKVSSTWDFADTWYSAAGVNKDYPVLKAFEGQDAVIITQPTDVTTNDGTAAIFSVALDGKYMPTYQWYTSTDNGGIWAEISGATASDYRMTASSADDGSMYKCTLTFGDGSTIDSQPAVLTVVNGMKTVHTEVYLDADGPGTGGYVYEGGILQTTSDSVDLKFTAIDGYSLSKVTIGGMDGTDVTKDITAVPGGWTYTFDLTGTDDYIWVSYTPAVTVNVLLDGEPYTGYDKTIILRDEFSGMEYTSTGTLADGKYVAGVQMDLSAIYYVFVKSNGYEVDTGLEIEQDNTSVDINYYTLNYKITYKPTATENSSISATDNFGTVADGGAVLGGKVVKMVAVGAGATGTGATYSYKWSDTSVPALDNTKDQYVPTINSATTIECEVTGHNGTADMTVNIRQNDSTYTEYAGTIELKQDDNTVFSGTPTGGVLNATVPSGEYSVFADGYDTGQTVSDQNPTANVDLYSVNYRVEDSPDGTSSGSTISSQTADGSIVLKGASLTIEVTGNGSDNYQYAWTDNASTTNVLTIDSVQGKVDTVCTVTGSDNVFDITVNIRLNDSPYTEYAKEIELKQNGNTVFSGTPTDGVLTTQIKFGNYQIFADNTDIGQTVSEQDPVVYVDLYSVNYRVVDSPDGTSSGSTISSQVADGSIVLKGTSVTIEVTANGSNNYQYAWTDSASTTNVLTLDNIQNKVDVVCTVLGSDEAVVTPPVKEYFITASSDFGAFVDPNGTITVERGDDRSFTFGAKVGYIVSDVVIDGESHTELISAGKYTFTNVMMNHTIVIKNDKKEITLNVEILEGKGHVEYSVNGGPFTMYDGSVVLDVNSDVVLKAYPDDGYKFVEWSGDIASSESELSVEDITDSVHLKATFKEDAAAATGLSDRSWYLIGAFLILLAILFIILIFFFRRSYEVVKLPPETISGKDKARRKKPYEFTVEGKTGHVFYRIGDDGHWKSLLPDEEGKFVVPEDDVVDKITIDAAVEQNKF